MKKVSEKRRNPLEMKRKTSEIKGNEWSWKEMKGKQKEIFTILFILIILVN